MRAGRALPGPSLHPTHTLPAETAGTEYPTCASLVSTVADNRHVCSIGQDYSSMKKLLLAQLERFSSYAYTQYDNWKDRVRKDDRLLLHKFHMVVCDDNTPWQQTRRRRQAGEEGALQAGGGNRQRRQAEESQEERNRRAAGSRLGYECGPARKFEDPETGEQYSERWLECHWNQVLSSARAHSLPYSAADLEPGGHSRCLRVGAVYRPARPAGRNKPNLHLGRRARYSNSRGIYTQLNCLAQWSSMTTRPTPAPARISSSSGTGRWWATT